MLGGLVVCGVSELAVLGDLQPGWGGAGLGGPGRSKVGPASHAGLLDPRGEAASPARHQRGERGLIETHRSGLGASPLAVASPKASPRPKLRPILFPQDHRTPAPVSFLTFSRSFFFWDQGEGILPQTPNRAFHPGVTAGHQFKSKSLPSPTSCSSCPAHLLLWEPSPSPPPIQGKNFMLREQGEAVQQNLINPNPHGFGIFS